MTDDDEVTTDVDPAWVAALRAGRQDPEATGTQTTGAEPPGDPADDVDRPDHDWFDRTDVRTSDAAGRADDFDAESTIGASSELLARIRAEIGTPGTGSGPLGEAPHAVAPEATSTSPSPLPPPILAQPAPAAPDPTSAPPPAPPVAPTNAPTTAPATAQVEEQSSMTVRWEPRQRLTGAAPLTDAPLASSHQTHHVLDRTRIVIAVIVAVTLVVVVWLFVRSDGDDSPPPPAGSVPAEPGEPADGGPGGGGQGGGG